MSLNLKESFECESKFEAFYTGGNIVWSEDGENLFCQNQNHIAIVSVNKGAVKTLVGTSAENEEDIINCFDVNKDCNYMITHHKSSLFKLWSIKDGKLVKVWKSIHNGPVAKISFAKKGLFMASGGVDSSIRLWDIEHQACTQNFKDAKGVVGILEFHPDDASNQLFASADDNVIHCWDINTGRKEIHLEGHFSKVTSISFHEDGIHALSSGRDRVLILWNIKTKKSLRVLPVYECLEGSFIIPDNVNFPSKLDKSTIYAASAGEKGTVKIWDMKSGHLVFEQINSLVPAAKDENALAIKQMLYNKQNNTIGIVSTSHNILIYSLDNFICTKQLVGYIDEILDVVYLGNEDSHVAVATNTADIKFYELSTMNCKILSGHNNIVLSLATSPANRELLISSDKDGSVRLWLMDEEAKNISCIGIATRHTAAVGSVAFSQATANFFVSVSQDSCLKVWDTPNNLNRIESTDIATLNSVKTVVAHEKDINCVTVSPNDKLIATGSQDKTAKLWSADDLQLLGVFRGHRRGVWCVRFSSIDQVLATSSADCTIKLWCLSGLNCLKTFEGHDCAVLRLEFLSRGMQILSSGADGLIKLWNIKTSECVTTLDEHNDKVWTLAVDGEEKHFISGDSNSVLGIWRDTTEEKKAKAIAENEELARDEQKLANFLKTEKLGKALRLALRLGKPKHVLKILETMLNKDHEEISMTISELKPALLEELLKCAITWNTNGRNCQVAQLIINIVLRDIGMENIGSSDLKSKLEALIPYTDRHFKRLTQLYQDLHILKYAEKCMKSHKDVMETSEVS